MADSTESTESASVARNVVECEAIYNMAHIYRPLIQRSYDDPFNWYYITFKPFTDSYDKEYDRYQICLNIVSDWCRNKSDLGIITREILAKKTHLNALVCSNKDLLKLHGTNIHKRGLKYKLHVDLVPTFEDRERVLEYIFKESSERRFDIYVDHMSYITATLKNMSRGALKERPESSSSSDTDSPQGPIIKRNLFNVCNGNRIKLY